MTIVKTQAYAILAVVFAIFVSAFFVNSAAAQVTTLNVTVKKVVVGGNAVASNFLIHVYQNGNDIAGSPQAGSATGTVYTIPSASGADFQVVEEEGGPVGYDVSFSGDCDSEGHLIFDQTDRSITCTVNNTFVGSSNHHHNNHSNDNNSNIDDLLTLIALNHGIGSPIPGVVVPPPCAQVCPPQGQTTTPTTQPTVPGVPNTGAGGDAGSVIATLLATLLGAAFAALKLRRS